MTVKIHATQRNLNFKKPLSDHSNKKPMPPRSTNLQAWNSLSGTIHGDS